jgi:hypothetical protein
VLLCLMPEQSLTFRCKTRAVARPRKVPRATRPVKPKTPVQSKCIANLARFAIEGCTGRRERSYISPPATPRTQQGRDDLVPAPHVLAKILNPTLARCLPTRQIVTDTFAGTPWTNISRPRRRQQAR